MSDNQDSEISSAHHEGENNGIENIIQVYQQYVDEVNSEETEQTTESDAVLQTLVEKFQQVVENDSNIQELINKALPLCGEFEWMEKGRKEKRRKEKYRK
ncbi:unnamed protein product [Rotaria magnacalcarata]|uniref:Uncharacterized protein n=1 Tax=Rotaria magnacalcarata TaxID=392030 RepID=A0A816CC89_9BILA|nr:unnamed protein product [Rotaria magnacalcarata]CAF1622835.1 unnamed protein product [Rotaria magnacalcarata]CAF2074791.1 unnamed protein product [Rotaria magnacalcarata]CAF3888086.1 unnamed protein product [Rotaria magnacalcarata]CAF3897507.1 unnamed protein product [Rotaria magnacalcarata]